MATPFLGEIRLYSFNYPPRGWAYCNGQLLSIQQNVALFSLIGTFYGGDGVRTFQLPNAQGRLLAHMSSFEPVGTYLGTASSQLTVQNLPDHNHLVAVAATASSSTVQGGYFAVPNVNARMQDMYGASHDTAASPLAVGNTGGSQPHENRQPFLALNYCIALQGIFPSQN